MSISEIKEEIINLYLNVKISKLEDEEIAQEKNSLRKLSISDIINYIYNSIEILINIKANEKYEEKLEEDEKKEKYKNLNDTKDENGLKLYEGLLIKAEKDIREHIKIENQLKLKIEELENEIEELKRKKITKDKINENKIISKTLDLENENYYKKITNNQNSIISDLKRENDRLRIIISSYEKKNKKYTKIKKEIKKNKEIQHNISSKIYHPSFVKLDHMKLNNSSIVNLNKKNISKEPEKRPSSSEIKKNNLQITFNPSLKKIDPLTITKIFIENTKKTKSNSVSTKRQISRMKSREITTSLSNCKTKDKKNESVMVNRKYKKFINEFKTNTLKKFEEKNKNSHKNLIKSNGKITNQISNKSNLQNSSSNYKNHNNINNNNSNINNSQNIFKNHPNIMKRLNKHNVIINNFNSYNYINVYSSSTKEKVNKKKI